MSPTSDEFPPSLDPAAPAATAALIALNSESIFPTALLDLPDLPSPRAAAMRVTAATTVTALACTVREAPGALPGTAGVVVLPSAPKASATMTLSLRLPG